MPDRVRRLRVYAAKWRHHESASLPWNRLALKRELIAREAYARRPLRGNVLQALRNGWLTLEPGVHFEPHVWLDVLGGHLSIGRHTALNLGVFVSVVERVEIGAHCMFANGCFITDADHRYDDPVRPVPWQGMRSRGPTRIGDNVWCGVNVAILGGVTIGERCVIGANSVVTRDLPARTICAGVPAKPIRPIEYGAAVDAQ